MLAGIEEARVIQASAPTSALERTRRDGRISPVVPALLATSAAFSLAREAELGVDTGHAEIMEAIGAFLSEVEPE